MADTPIHGHMPCRTLLSFFSVSPVFLVIPQVPRYYPPAVVVLELCRKLRAPDDLAVPVPGALRGHPELRLHPFASGIAGRAYGAQAVCRQVRPFPSSSCFIPVSLCLILQLHPFTHYFLNTLLAACLAAFACRLPFQLLRVVPDRNRRPAQAARHGILPALFRLHAFHVAVPGAVRLLMPFVEERLPAYRAGIDLSGLFRFLPGHFLPASIGTVPGVSVRVPDIPRISHFLPAPCAGRMCDPV